MKTRNKWSRILTVFIVVMSSTIYAGRVYGSANGIGFTVGTIPANAGLGFQKEAFNMLRFGFMFTFNQSPHKGFGSDLKLERIARPSQRDFSTLNAAIAFYYRIPIISNVSIYPGAEFGGNKMDQKLIRPYMGTGWADTGAFYGRGFVGLELFNILAAEIGWSKYATFKEWTVSDPNIQESNDTPVPNELLSYSKMEVGGYEVAAFVRFRFNH